MTKLERRKELIEKLDIFLPVVEKVHGKHHPEIYKVGELYKSIREKYGSQNFEDSKEEFQEIKAITNDYKIPEGVCESYEAVYQMLKELDVSI